MMTLDGTRPGTAAGAVGVAQAAYEYSVEYAKERVQFGQPIAMNQGVNFMVADMATEIEAARLLVWQAAWLIEQGKRATLQSSFAKRFAADMVMKVTTDAVQIFGGYGYIKEYPVEKLMRDAKLFQIYEGTSQIQRLVIATGRYFLPRMARRSRAWRSTLNRPSGRVALVTGGSRGLGRADALDARPRRRRRRDRGHPARVGRGRRRRRTGRWPRSPGAGDGLHRVDRARDRGDGPPRARARAT